MKHSQPVGVCVVLVNDKGQILLGKRKNSYKAGLYGMPGGRVEINEPLEAAVSREVFEETGLEIEKFEYLGVVRENQGDYDFIHFVFTAKVGESQPQLCEPEKCEGWEWLEPDIENQEILPGHSAAIKLYQSGEKMVDVTD